MWTFNCVARFECVAYTWPDIDGAAKAILLSKAVLCSITWMHVLSRQQRQTLTHLRFSGLSKLQRRESCLSMLLRREGRTSAACKIPFGIGGRNFLEFCQSTDLARSASKSDYEQSHPLLGELFLLRTWQRPVLYAVRRVSNVYGDFYNEWVPYHWSTFRRFWSALFWLSPHLSQKRHSDLWNAQPSV